MNIFIPSNQKVPHETHAHKCPFPWCKKEFHLESNMVCQKTLKGTGLDHHVFPCMNHIHDWRNRFGIESIMDAYLEREQVQRFRHEWPDAHIAQREEREAKQSPDMRVAVKEPK